MIKHDNAIQTEDDKNTTKELITGRVGKNTYALTVVTHHKDGKSIIYRRHKSRANSAYKPFNVTELNVDERTCLGLELMKGEWDIIQVAVFVGLPTQAFKKRH